MLLFRKWIAKSPYSLKNSNQKGPYITDTSPHNQFLFPMWPAYQKELPTPVLGGSSQSWSLAQVWLYSLSLWIIVLIIFWGGKVDIKSEICKETCSQFHQHFTHVGPKSAKRHWWLDCLFLHLGSSSVNSARKMLMKMRPARRNSTGSRPWPACRSRWTPSRKSFPLKCAKFPENEKVIFNTNSCSNDIVCFRDLDLMIELWLKNWVDYFWSLYKFRPL